MQTSFTGTPTPNNGSRQTWRENVEEREKKTGIIGKDTNAATAAVYTLVKTRREGEEYEGM